MDNASGIATLIEAASAIVAAKPKRSVLFVAVTAEEKGLLGSRYFARNPTVPRASIVADINMDMFLPLYPLRQLMVLGLDESDLGDDVRAVAAAVGIGVQADPQPLRNRFIRSDQYSFIREGVPVAGDEGRRRSRARRKRRSRPRGRRTATTRRPTTCSSRSTAPRRSGSPR